MPDHLPPRDDWSAGAAYIDSAIMPIGEARIPITDWGYRRSDVTYDVVSVWNGAFFRLNDHLRRFRASMTTFRLAPRETDAEIAAILHRLVGRSGLREAYVAMDCVRARPRPGMPYHPAAAGAYLIAFAIPYVWLMPQATIARGVHLSVSSTPRIPEACVDPRAKNFHWGDMTKSLFEAHDKGADNTVLLDLDGNVTEGPGFNVFAVTNGIVATPDRGVLEGITRLAAIELCGKLGLPCEVRKVSIAELRDADEIFITSTSGGVMGVTRLDGRILGNDRPGPITENLRQSYWTFREQGWETTPVEYETELA
jgi:branched-chain amino acid aminotransferase